MVKQKEPLPFIQRGTTTTDASGNLDVTFAKEFVSTPIIILTPLHAADNYQAIIRTRATTGFTGHVRKLKGGHTHTNPTSDVDGGWTEVPTSQKSVGDIANPNVHPHYTNDTPQGLTVIHSAAKVLETNHLLTHTHTQGASGSTEGDSAAGAGIVVHWIAIQP